VELKMSYSLATLWYERQRYFPAMLAVAFSALLVGLQCGLVMGALSVVSIPLDHTAADLWLGAPEVSSVDTGCPIPLRWGSRLDMPEIQHHEVFVQGFTYWHKPSGGSELCVVLGSRLHESALGAVQELTPSLRAQLTEPGSVVVDQADLKRLGLKHGPGEVAEINGQHVRVVGLVQGLKGLGGAYVFCSIATAQRLLRLPREQTIYLLARCRDRADAPAVVQRLRRYTDMAAFTTQEFSARTQQHWLFSTGAGTMLGMAAALGLLVGAVITSQTLYAATAVSLREYAVLQALGIPRWRMAATVLAQSFWIGLVGIGLALPAIFGLASVAEVLGAKVFLPKELVVSTAAGTLAMAVLSGLAALRSLRLIEPAVLLR
jgi:putative ABC transport system permease protein